MRNTILLFFAAFFVCQSGCQNVASHATQEKAERKPFKRSPVKIETPKVYAKRESGKGEYDPRPRVVPIDERAGKYELRWIGYDGKTKIIKYQRHGTITGVLEARVEEVEGKFTYKYLVKNFADSPTHLLEFIVQTFSSDIRDEYIRTGDDNLRIGHMASYIPHFSKGVWRRFAPLGVTKPEIIPGTSVEFQLTSTAPPGVVECKAGGGEITLKGVGEHMPSELEWALPGYDDLATCLTIGPVESLAKLSNSEKTSYLLENLSKFQEAGWMASGTAKIYERILKQEDLAGALVQAKKDLEKDFITSEVFHIIHGLKSNHEK